MASKFQNLLPFAAMLVSSSLYTGLKVISKAAMARGMSSYVLIVYSMGISAFLFLPALFFSLRMDRHQPPLTFQMLCKLFILGLLAMALGPNLLLTGIKYSSPTLASAISNLEPAVTFLLAVTFRMEKLDIKLFGSQIKILGTIVSILGALTMTLYRGPRLWSSMPYTFPQFLQLQPLSEWVLGGFCLVLATFASAGSNILQASVLKGYPFEITVVFLCTLIGTIQCAAMTLIVENDIDAWKLQADIKLAAVVCIAVFNSVASYIVVWCIGKKGPVFVAMFGPLGIVIAAPISALFLGDNLTVGSVVGAVIIVSGFYAVIWAKSKDLPSISSSQKIPLMQNLGDQ